MSIRQINQSHRYSNVKYIVKSHNMFGIYHRMRFRCVFGNSYLQGTKVQIISDLVGYIIPFLEINTTKDPKTAKNLILRHLFAEKAVPLQRSSNRTVTQRKAFLLYPKLEITTPKTCMQDKTNVLPLGLVIQVYPYIEPWDVGTISIHSIQGLW